MSRRLQGIPKQYNTNELTLSYPITCEHTKTYTSITNIPKISTHTEYKKKSKIRQPKDKIWCKHYYTVDTELTQKLVFVSIKDFR